jgi:hypothetical protein
MAERGTNQINSGTTSAEDFPWASTANGGSKAYVFPGTVAEQRSKLILDLLFDVSILTIEQAKGTRSKLPLQRPR